MVLTVVLANGTLNALAAVEVVTVAAVETAAVPEVFWLPAVLTPGKLMFAEPLNETPPIVRAVWSVVAVAALPDVELDVEALPFRAAVIVPALKLPEPSRNTIWLAVLVLAAVMVALLAWLVMVAALPEIEIA